MKTAGHAKAGMSLCAVALLALSLILPGCKLGEQKKSSKGTSTSVNTSTTSTNTAVTTLKTILVSWSPNRESAVNTTGGGYKVYYSKTDATVSVVTSSVVNVPFVSGTLSPTTAQLTGLTAGTYFVKVVAFSSRNTAGSVSAISSLVVP